MVRALTELADRVEEIDQRLLSLSTGVELEIDRLDIVRAEIERLSQTRRPNTTRG